MADAAALIGSWRMESWTRTDVETGESVDVLGADPVGYIAYHADGRMMAAVYARGRLAPKAGGWEDAERVALYDSMMSYVAAYTLEEDRVIHHVEAAWDPNWQVDLSRPFTLNGDRLVIAGAPGRDPATGKDAVYRMEFCKV